MNIGTISNPCLKVKPSKKLFTYIKNKVKVTDDIPEGIGSIIFKNSKSKSETIQRAEEPNYLLTDEDRDFINKLTTDKTTPAPKTSNLSKEEIVTDKVLTLKDLQWVYKYMQDNETGTIYFHELFEGSEIVLPKNDLIPRNEELEKRCQQYRNQFSNEEYHRMTQKINVTTKKLPEDTISYQLKEMNRYLIAIFQFIISVMTGFAFGFMGIELIIGNMAFGVRLVLGVTCALTVALAELYFLVKTLNEEIVVEKEGKKRMKEAKLS